MRSTLILCIVLLLSGYLSAGTVTGMIDNGTTGKPAVGVDVVLIRLEHGTEVAGRTKTRVDGLFTFHLSDPGPFLIRAIHRGVTYQRMVPAGATSVKMQVFDVSRNIDGISVTADVMRFQAQGDELQGIRLLAVNNASNPPRTQLHGKDFEFFLPDGAHIDQWMALTADGQPVDSSPVTEKEKNRYGFIFPLRPGETQFQVVFHMKYSGTLSVETKTLYGAQHFVVMVPKAMQFVPAPGVAFQSMEDPRQPDALVRVVSNTRVGQSLNFTISGTGTLLDPGDDSLGAPHPVEDRTTTSSASAARIGEATARVGPATDPVKTYRWYILGGFGLLLGAGAIYLIKRSSVSDRPIPATAPIPSSRSNLLLEDLKNKLFQLEVGRQQGGISQPEYERARAALDRTLDRVIKRAPAKRA